MEPNNHKFEKGTTSSTTFIFGFHIVSMLIFHVHFQISCNYPTNYETPHQYNPPKNIWPVIYETVEPCPTKKHLSSNQNPYVTFHEILVG